MTANGSSDRSAPRSIGTRPGAGPSGAPRLTFADAPDAIVTGGPRFHAVSLRHDDELTPSIHASHVVHASPEDGAEGAPLTSTDGPAARIIATVSYGGARREGSSMYRARRRACPRCRTPMDEVPVPGGEHVEVDTCPTCGGVFLEFFDGEPIGIARRISSPPRADEPTSREGPLVCPDCDAPMVARAYLGHGPEIPRCESCLAIFLDPALKASLARHELPQREPEPGWLEKLVGWLG